MERYMSCNEMERRVKELARQADKGDKKAYAVLRKVWKILVTGLIKSFIMAGEYKKAEAFVRGLKRKMGGSAGRKSRMAVAA